MSATSVRSDAALCRGCGAIERRDHMLRTGPFDYLCARCAEARG